MRNFWILILCVLGAAVLSACGGNSAATDKGACQKGVCVRAALNGALRLNENAPLVITISAEQPTAGLRVTVASDNPNAVIEGSDEWTLDVTPGAPQVLTAQVRVLAEGANEITSRVRAADGTTVEYKLTVGIAPGGATLEPAATGY